MWMHRYLKTKQAAGLDIVARKADGKVIAWRQRLVEHFINPEIAETLLLCMVLNQRVQLGGRDIIVESDCKNVIEATNSETVCHSAAGHYSEEIKAYSSFNNVLFIRGFCTANSMACELSN